MDKLGNIAVNRDAYPKFDRAFAEAAVKETVGYFSDVFLSDASALDLLDSNYGIVNDLLAEHYGLEVPQSGLFTKMNFDGESVRGGLLTQASVLTMNSDGADSHPIRRGVWLLDRLLSMPPPPPPPNVPDLDAADPDFVDLSLKEQIEKHRAPGACQSCHAKIDPWGIPFEMFDATGRIRSFRQTEGAATENGRKIDAAIKLPDDRTVAGPVSLKRHLREHYQKEFAESLTRNLLTYLLGRRLTYLDHDGVIRLRDSFMDSGFSMRSLVTEILCSELFEVNSID